MCVYEMGNLRVVDLSKILDPATETRRCHLFRFNTGGPIPDYHTNMDLMSHLLQVVSIYTGYKYREGSASVSRC